MTKDIWNLTSEPKQANKLKRLGTGKVTSISALGGVCWVCSCGKHNAQDNSVCWNCGGKKE